MKIAVHVDAVGRPVSLYEDGVIHLYEGSGDSWSKIGEFPFELPDGASIPLVRGLVERAAANLRDCRTLISGDRNGYIYSLLGQEMGFDCWTSEGAVSDQLAMVERRRGERAAEVAKAAPSCVSSGCSSDSCGTARLRSSSCAGKADGKAVVKAVVPAPENLGGGRFRVDLAALMRREPGLNSRDILFPLLEEGRFSELEIVCDHLPRWFSAKLAALDLSAATETRPDGSVFATISKV